MPYIGNSPATGENNSFKVLDDIKTYTLTFDGSSSSVVSVADDTITSNNHRFITGQRVTYTDGTGTAIGGLTDGTVYYIIKNDQNTIKLATSQANANAGTAINLTALGTGTNHTLNVAFDGVNTKFKATYDNGTKALVTRAAQLTLSVNGVIQEPQDTTTPTNGFGIDTDGVIIFSVAPVNTDTFWGNLVANNFPTFDISDNTIDNFVGTGSTTVFILSKAPANNQNILVTLDGVVQYPSDATTTRSYSVTGNTLTFDTAPGNGVDIQVRHIGFAGATSSAVTGFYGRTGNVGLTTADNVVVNNIFVGSATSTGTASQPLQVTGGGYVSGSVGIGTTNPLSSLHVTGSRNNIPTQPGVHIGEGGTNDFALDICCRNSSSNAYIDFTYPGQDYKARIIKTMGNDFAIQNTEATSMTFYNNDGVKLIIDSSGNVGVGIINLSSKFEIAQNTTSTCDLTITNLNTGNNVTKASRIRFRLTDSVATNKDVAYITAFPNNLDSSTGNYLSFSTRTLDATPTEKMRLNNNGVLTIPNQPAFYAYNTTGNNITNGNIIDFGTTTINIGSHYSTTTYKFTAPVAGTYYFYCQLLSEDNTGYTDFRFYVNGNVKGGGYSGAGTWTSGNGYKTATGSIVVTVAAGDAIDVRSAGTSSIHLDAAHTYFFGYLIG